MQASYRSLRRKRQSSLTSLHLLFLANFRSLGQGRGSRLARPDEEAPLCGASSLKGNLERVPSKLNNAKDSRTHANGLTLGTYERLVGTQFLLRKEVIQPHLPIRLPCYDFTPIIKPTFGRAPLAVRLRTSGVPDSHGVTGGVYKARERIHRGMLIRDY